MWPTDLHHINDSKSSTRHMSEAPAEPTLMEPAPAKPVQIRKATQQMHKIRRRLNVSCFKRFSLGVLCYTAVGKWIHCMLFVKNETIQYKDVKRPIPLPSYPSLLFGTISFTLATLSEPDRYLYRPFSFKHMHLKYIWNFASHTECNYVC